MSSDYSARHLSVLEGLEAVRKRPGMYIGSTDSRGLMHCLWEIIDNSVDEALGGHGTRIEIYLPRVDEPSRAAPSTAIGGEGTVSGHLLVVEDDPLVRAVLVRELATQGYQVAEAADGQSALDRIADTREPFDLLITDLAMPRMDGRELAARVAAVRPDLPVLYISGHPDEATRRALVEGEQPYLQKPFTAEELLSGVAEMLRRVR